MLDKLSTEILVLIFSELTERRDLTSVCQVSKRLHSVASSVLFRSIALKAKDLALDRVAVEGIIATHRQTGALHYTKDIHVSSPFHGRLEKRCLHYNTSSACGDDEDGLNDDDLQESEHQDKKTWIENDDAAFGRDDFCRFKDRLMAVLIRCREGMLENFTWQLGTCVPEEILGKNGYLPLKQKNLKSLRLITDASCEWNGYNLAPFTKLTSLSWHGLRPDIDFISIWKCFSVCSLQLIYLDLDYYSQSRTAAHGFEIWDDGGYEMQKILRPLSEGEQLFFPELRGLSLSGISLSFAEERLESAFDFQYLRSLKLRFCPGLEELLAHLQSAVGAMYLEKLEIQTSNDHFNDELELAIPNFLDIIEGLQELFISTCHPDDTLPIWCSIFRHHLTLKNVIPQMHPSTRNNTLKVLHIRQSGRDIKASRNWGVEEEMDADDLGSISSSDESDDGDNISIPFHSNDHGTVAKQMCPNNKNAAKPVSTNEENMAERIYPNEASQDLDFLAQWAFGKKGYPSLQLLAFGDFSFNGRYSSENVLLCRQQEPGTSRGKKYRHVTKDDSFALHLFRQYSHVLQACPSDPV
ncbi:conserved hypothetical protein [Microsporum canis CBS 113480]|uniref:F-box domain-containing protein n=1 Tax=Arthroderma otae (strain ATCC MYA-4605 / CBS 113480) TaxID=554155 RepID=C5FP51_ARTOC|nr:conserved hypothetical protein [Microsporum canis CBS 113480]EEQ31367.1 conserved hypothetical protein [Microsporum canis CBS 113480]